MKELVFESGVFVVWVGLIAGAVAARWDSTVRCPDDEFEGSALSARR